MRILEACNFSRVVGRRKYPYIVTRTGVMENLLKFIKQSQFTNNRSLLQGMPIETGAKKVNRNGCLPRIYRNCMLKIAEYRFWIIVVGLIAFCLASVAPEVSRADAPVDIEVASKKVCFSYATTGHHPFFSCAKEQTRPLEHLDDQPGILPDLSGLAIARELYLLVPVSFAHHTRLTNLPIRAPPILLS